MFDWINFLEASILCGLLTIYLLLFKKNALRSFSDYLLTVVILTQCWTVLLFVLVYSESILDSPHLYKTAAPISFLIAPLCYLYVRSVLFNELRFKKTDFLHALPFLFFLVNYLPFFASSTESKLDILNATLLDKNVAITTQLGLLPESFFYILRPIQTLFYLAFQWVLVLQFNKAFKVKEVQEQIGAVISWLKVFTLTNTAVFFSLVFLIGLYLSIPNIFEENLLSLIPNSLLSISFFVGCTYLLVNPQVLNGLPFVKYKEKKSQLISDELVKVPFIHKNYAKEIAQLEAYFASSKAYLQPNLSISEVAVATEIPNRELSFLINSYYKQRFSDYLNDMRLAHFLSQVDASSLDSFTIESIATASGFAYKSSFYRAFKKKYGSTPTAYLQPLISAQNAEKSS
jgi:AraC-like DNA-binding protein